MTQIKNKGEWILILKKWTKYYTKEILKALKIVTVGAVTISAIVFAKYKPAYRVEIAGQTVGFVTNREYLESEINNYINDTSGNIAFISAQELPDYKFELVNRNETDSSNEILSVVKDNSVITYKTYAITVDGNKEAEVATEEEANELVQKIKDTTQEGVEIDLGINAEYKNVLEVSNSESALAALNSIKDQKTEEYEEEQRRIAEEAAKKAAEEAAKAKQFAMQSTSTLAATGKLDGLSLSQPVSGMISSRFGSRSSVRSSAHTGLDIATASGTGIRAIAEGKVIFAGTNGSYGKLVKIDHGNGIESWYAHCSNIYVSVGEKVNSSTTIAAVGSTGNSTGPHLHLEIRINGTPVNPQNYLYK